MSLRKLVGKIGGVAKKIAPFTAFIPGVNIGVGAAAALGGLGAVAERAGQKGANLGNVLGAGAQGAAVGGAGNWAGGKALGALGQLGAGGGAGGEGGAGGGLSGIAGGAWDAVKGLGGAALGGINQLGGGNTLLGAGALGMLGMQLHDQRQQREAAQAFEQQRVDMLNAMMARAEADYDSRAPMREKGQEAMLGALGAMQQDPITQWLGTMQQRQPGEYMARGA